MNVSLRDDENHNKEKKENIMSQNPGKHLSEIKFKDLKPGVAFVHTDHNKTKAVIEEASTFDNGVRNCEQVSLRCENNRLIALIRGESGEHDWRYIESITQPEK